jgi:hypothetical protein
MVFYYNLPATNLCLVEMLFEWTGPEILRM